MNLREQLERLRTQLANGVPQELKIAIDNGLKELTLNKSTQGLQIGDRAPNFTLPDPTGKSFTLYDYLGTGHAVLSFYRGSW